MMTALRSTVNQLKSSSFATDHLHPSAGEDARILKAI